MERNRQHKQFKLADKESTRFIVIQINVKKLVFNANLFPLISLWRRQKVFEN